MVEMCKDKLKSYSVSCRYACLEGLQNTGNPSDISVGVATQIRTGRIPKQVTSFAAWYDVVLCASIRQRAGCMVMVSVCSILCCILNPWGVFKIYEMLNQAQVRKMNSCYVRSARIFWYIASCDFFILFQLNTHNKFYIYIYIYIYLSPFTPYMFRCLLHRPGRHLRLLQITQMSL